MCVCVKLVKTKQSFGIQSNFECKQRINNVLLNWLNRKVIIRIQNITFIMIFNKTAETIHIMTLIFKSQSKEIK